MIFLVPFSRDFFKNCNFLYLSAVLFEMFMPLIGQKCIQYANGTDGRARRHLYDKVLTHDAVKRYFLQFQEVRCLK